MQGIWETSQVKEDMYALQMLAVHPFTDKDTPIDPTQDAIDVYQSIVDTDGCEVSLDALQFNGSYSWEMAYQGIIWPTVMNGSVVGVNLADMSRLISYDMIQSAQKKQEMKDYIVNLPLTVSFIWQNSAYFLDPFVSCPQQTIAQVSARLRERLPRTRLLCTPTGATRLPLWMSRKSTTSC